MGIALSIEIYEDRVQPGLFRWVFLDSSGDKHGPSVGFTSRWEAKADVERILATHMDKKGGK